MIRRFSLLACLVAALSALAVPVLAYAAPLPTAQPALSAQASGVPATQAPAPAVVLAPAEGQAPLTAEEVTLSTPNGQPLAGLRVRTGPADLFTVLCREWEAQPGAGALRVPGTSWFYSEQPAAAAALDLAGRLPMVGHTCAVARDPSPANIARLAFDVVTVIVFIQTVAHALPAISGLAVAMSHAPGALAAASILLEQGPGLVTTIRGSMDQVQRLNNLGDEMQDRLRAGALAQVRQPQELKAVDSPAYGLLAAPAEPPALAAGPAPAGKLLQRAATADAPANQAGISAAANAARSAVLDTARQGLASAGQALRTTGPAVWQSTRNAGAQAASAATGTGQRLGAALQNACVELPFARLGCHNPALPAQ